MPKWTNKGHEFDELGNYFKENKNIILAGKDQIKLNEIKKRLSFINTADIHITTKKFNSLELKMLRFFKKANFENNSIIIVPNEDIKTYNILKNSRNLTENLNLFSEQTFFSKYLGIFAYYVANKVYSPIGTCLIATTLYTLNCKYCLNYQPYIKNKKHMDFNELISNIDIFFSKFDKVEYFAVSGGEPLLYPKLKELLLYICENYINKIGELGFATNGSIVLNDELSEIIKKYNIRIQFDNYSKNIDWLKESTKKCIEKIKKDNLYCTSSFSDDIQFFKSFPAKNDYRNLNDKTQEERCKKCKDFYSGYALKNHKIYACCYASSAETADLVPAVKEDYFDLDKDFNKIELVEFMHGFSEKGYLEFCKYCNGFPSINPDKDENGVTQLPKGKVLEWDINNPTYIEY